MKQLPANKRNQLVMVVIATIALISLVYFFLIQPQHNKILQLAGELNSKRAELQKMKETIKQAEVTTTNLASVSRHLIHAEEDVASGDVYAWTYDTLRRFKANYHVDIPTIGQPTLSDVDLLPDFPYRQVKTSLIGTGYFHDIGKFVSDFENNFPHMRLVDLSLEPGGSADSGSERLNFRVDVVTLVKSNP